MSIPCKYTLLSPEEYLEGEKVSTVKHEYVTGHIYAMVGASAAHNRIAGNLYTALIAKLRGGPCGVFISDLKVRVEQAEVFYYPDIVVSCHPEDLKPASYYISHPKLIIEVLSPSTERTDREEKLYHYRKLVSLEEYVLAAQDMIMVWVYRRASDGWSLEALAEGQGVQLASVGLEIPIETIYEDVWR